MSDKHFASVGLLLKFEGSDGSATFTDEGPTGHAVTANGNAQVDSAQFKFGAASGLFDGNGDFLSVPDHADWDLGDQPFTVEGFVRFADLNGGERGGCLLSQYNTVGNQRSWGFFYNNNGGNHSLAFLHSPDGSGGSQLDGPWPGGAPVLNTWYHVAADRDANDVLRVYVEGQVVGQEDLTGFTFHNSTASLEIGRINSSTGFRRFLNGWIDGLRLTKGVARYAGSFSPPQGPFSTFKAVGTTRPHRGIALVPGAALVAPPAFLVYGDGDSSGGSTIGREWAADRMMLQNYQMPVAGKVVSILPWLRTGSSNMYAVAYDDAAGVPGNLLAAKEAAAVSADDYFEIQLDEADYFDVTLGQTIWLGVFTDLEVQSRSAVGPVSLGGRRITGIISYAGGPPDPAPSMGTYSANRPLRVKIRTNP